MKVVVIQQLIETPAIGALVSTADDQQSWSIETTLANAFARGEDYDDADLVLVEMMPSLNEAERFVQAPNATRNRYRLVCAGVPGPRAGVPGPRWRMGPHGTVVVDSLPPLRTAVVERSDRTHRLLVIAQEVVRELRKWSPLPRGHEAALRLHPEHQPMSTSLGGYVPPPDREMVCRVDQPLVFEGPFLRTYDDNIVVYVPVSEIKQIRVGS